VNAIDEALAEFLEVMSEFPAMSQASRDRFARAALIVRTVSGSEVPGISGEFFVGVKNGKPALENCGDSAGDTKEVTLYVTPEAATARYHNVRRCRLIVQGEPVRAPESWGAIDG